MTNLVSTLEEKAECNELAEELYHSYKNTYRYLESEYYGWIQSNCPHFTDHGERHIQTVINKSGEILEDELKSENIGALNFVEIYVLLASIIWHDVGMVQDRGKHENFPTKISEDITETLFPNTGIQRLVSRIVKSHTGNTALSIPTSKGSVTLGHQTFDLHPKAIAAVLRFADEISENQERVSRAAAVFEEVPEESKIYWEYAKSITAISVELARDRVVVNFELDKEQATTKYPCPDKYVTRSDDENRISVIEYIVCRLEKMNNEKVYCAPEFRRYAYIREIQAKFRVFDEDGHEFEEFSQELGEGGVKKTDQYPDIHIYEDFFNENGDLKPSTISTES